MTLKTITPGLWANVPMPEAINIAQKKVNDMMDSAALKALAEQGFDITIPAGYKVVTNRYYAALGVSFQPIAKTAKVGGVIEFKAPKARKV